MNYKDNAENYFFSKINNKIIRFNRRIETINNKIPECLVIIIWSVFHFIISIFHERWFDEAVAWQISKNATIKDILFNIPHYEGHPFLWHLILRPFSKIGAPYNFSLTLISFVFMGMAIYLVLFKTSLPRLIRLCLPFTYFILYQYGIISRPYCLMALFVICTAITHKERNEKPFKYIIYLFLLCLSSAFGIIMAFGICLVWLFEIIRADDKKISVLIHDSRIKALAILAILALLLVISIIPANNTYAGFDRKESITINNILTSLIYTLFVLPADSILTNCFNENSKLISFEFGTGNLVFGILIGLSILGIVALYGKKKGTMLYYFVPHLFLACFSALVYFTVHHIGVWFLLMAFWTIITYDSDKQNESILYDKCKKLFSQLYGIVISIIVILSLGQGIVSCTLDIKYEYSYSKKIANYFIDNNFDDYKIMIGWIEKENGKIFPYMTSADMINAYVGKNIFYNYYDGEEEYIHHDVMNDEEIDLILESWKEEGYPDILIDRPDLEDVFDDKNAYKKYIPIYRVKTNMIWKGLTPSVNEVYVYMKTELAEKLGIKKIRSPIYDLFD